MSYICIMRMVEIYTLAHPITGEVRYIGKTVQKLSVRLSEHMRVRDNSHRSSWIRQLKNANLVPVISVIESVSEDVWIDRERYWIKKYRDEGYRLINTTDGGDAFRVEWDEDSRKRLSEMFKGRPITWDLNVESKKKGVDRYSIDGVFIDTFSSMSEAHSKLGFSTSRISECCNGKGIVHAGYVFRFNGEPFNKYFVGDPRCVKIRRINKNDDSIKEYDSINEASVDSGVIRQSICKAMKKEGDKKGTLNQYKFVYI